MEIEGAGRDGGDSIERGRCLTGRGKFELGMSRTEAENTNVVLV